MISRVMAGTEKISWSRRALSIEKREYVRALTLDRITEGVQVQVGVFERYNERIEIIMYLLGAGQMSGFLHTEAVCHRTI